MKNIARRIIAAIFPRRRNCAATVSYSGMLFSVSIDAPDERRVAWSLTRSPMAATSFPSPRSNSAKVIVI